MARTAAGRLSFIVRPLVEEILDSCDGATASSGEAKGVAGDISRSVERLGESVTESMRSLASIRVESDEATGGVVAALSEVRADVHRSVGDIQALTESVAGLRTFVATISGIADQTRLLSLNARIEAAHAGDAGRGFAVVAEEVRKLADTAKEQANEVAETIAGICAEAERATAAVDETISRWHC